MFSYTYCLLFGWQVVNVNENVNVARMAAICPIHMCCLVEVGRLGEVNLEMGQGEFDSQYVKPTRLCRGIF